MKQIKCKIELKDENGNTIVAKDIFDFVQKSKKREINYDNPIVFKQMHKNGKLTTELLGTNKTITEYNFSGIYFIFSDADELLYIGKSQEVNKRLTQHLISCSSSTSSCLHLVLNYLLELQKNNLDIKLKYVAIETADNKCNATIEGALIDYAVSNSSQYSKLWSIRRD